MKRRKLTVGILEEGLYEISELIEYDMSTMSCIRKSHHERD